MPTILQPDELPRLRQRGLSVTTLGTPATLGTEALRVEHIQMDANATTAPFGTAQAERFLYVIRGAGQAQAGGEEFALGPESMLWIEAQDSCTLESGPEGLEVLICRAPAG